MQGAGTRGGEAHRLAGAYAGGRTIVVGGAGLAPRAHIQRRLAASAKADEARHRTGRGVETEDQRVAGDIGHPAFGHVAAQGHGVQAAAEIAGGAAA